MKKLGIAVATASALLLSACGTDPSPTPAAGVPAGATAGAKETHEMHGYPLDRSLAGLVNWKDLDTVVVVKGLSYQKAIKLGGQENGFSAVVTPASATVEKVLLGKAQKGKAINTVFAGGDTGSIVVHASEELAPSLTAAKKAPTLVIAGQMRTTPETGAVLDPTFVYELDSTGRLTTLLESGGAEARPSFTLDQLVKALAKR